MKVAKPEWGLTLLAVAAVANMGNPARACIGVG